MSVLYWAPQKFVSVSCSLLPVLIDHGGYNSTPCSRNTPLTVSPPLREPRPLNGKNPVKMTQSSFLNKKHRRHWSPLPMPMNTEEKMFVFKKSKQKLRDSHQMGREAMILHKELWSTQLHPSCPSPLRMWPRALLEHLPPSFSPLITLTRLQDWGSVTHHICPPHSGVLVSCPGIWGCQTPQN